MYAALRMNEKIHVEVIPYTTRTHMCLFTFLWCILIRFCHLIPANHIWFPERSGNVRFGFPVRLFSVRQKLRDRNIYIFRFAEPSPNVHRTFP